MFQLAAASVAVLLGVACLSPTLPLPPPEPSDTMQPLVDQPGVWQLRGDCYVGALVTVFNENTRKGSLTEDTDRNGRYSLEIEAQLCDTVTIWQEVVTDEDANETSSSTRFVIEERTPDGVVNPCPTQ